MNLYKRFTYFFSIVVILLICFHFTVWNLYTKYVVINDSLIYKGDLTRKSYKVDSVFPRYSFYNKKSTSLENKHIPLQNYNDEKIDIITIGDSFSNGDTQGLNVFYQDYISTYNSKKVLNIPRQIIGNYNYIEIISMLNNSKVLDTIKPKYILVESVERFSIDRFSNSIDFSRVDKDNKLYNTLKNSEYYFFNSEDQEKYLDFININNFKALRNNFTFKFLKKDGLFSGVYIEPLKKELFTSKDKSSLLFLKQDIDNIILSTKEKVEKLNYNFNKLAEILNKNNIKLYFMPVVDKYNLYSQYLENSDKYPKSLFFELLRELPKKYTLIDTKKILLEELEKGEKDIYYSDDTHWSYKASEAIFKKVKFE